MIRLTFKDGCHFIANPELLEGVFPSSDGKETYLKYSGSSNVTVIESYEEVARKVLEWQYFYERFKAFARAWAAQIDEKVSLTMYDGMESAREELRRLAGLEDMNHDEG